jgi:hypothetical protein
LIFLVAEMTTMQSLQYIGRPVFALTLLLMLWSSARQWVRERQLRDLDTKAARDEIAALRKWHMEFRIGMLLLAIISMIPG